MHSLYTALASIFLFSSPFSSLILHTRLHGGDFARLLAVSPFACIYAQGKGSHQLPANELGQNRFPSWLEGGLDAVPPGAIFLLSLMSKSVQQDLVLVCFCVQHALRHRYPCNGAMLHSELSELALQSSEKQLSAQAILLPFSRLLSSMRVHLLLVNLLVAL